MTPLEKLERKLHWNSNFNLMLVFIGCYLLGTFLSALIPGFREWIAFHPGLILKGQIWRLFTFVFSGSSSSIFMMLLICFCYYSISTGLIRLMGAFRLNFFLVLGLLLLVVFGFIYYFIMLAVDPTGIYAQYVLYLDATYLYSMLFILFALYFPDAQFLFMFIIPVRAKWLIFGTIIIDVVMVVMNFVRGNIGYAWILLSMLLAVALDFFIFMKLNGQSFSTLGTSGGRRRSRVYIHPNKNRDKYENSAANTHRCAICGRTEKTNPELEFRYCSRCMGNYEYCMEHLYTHQHVRPQGETENINQ